MAWTLETSNTTTTDGTEQTLATLTGNKSYVFEIDLALLANGDTIRILVYGKTLSGGTEHIHRDVSFANIQGEPIKQFEPIASDISTRITITRSGGSDHAYPWKVLSI